MSLNAFLHILVVNTIREGTGKQSGQPYRMQDCECAIVNERGEPQEVGVLMLSKDHVGLVTPGHYAGSFALRADKSKEGQRRIGAVITGLQPLKLTEKGFVPNGPAVGQPKA